MIARLNVEVMNVSVIMYNMIVESERDADAPYECQSPLAEPHQVSANFAQFPAMCQKNCDKVVHEQLLDDLVEHSWALKGNEAI